MINVSRPVDLPGTGEIGLIGDRASGKTTFMAALAYWPNAKTKSPIVSVDPYDTPTGDLIRDAQDILLRGDQFGLTELRDDIHQTPTYSLLIELEPSLCKHPLLAIARRTIRLQVSSRDYAGELIDRLRNNDENDDKLKGYLDDCAKIPNLLMLIDSTSRADEDYSQALDNLRDELSIRLSGDENAMGSYRIAVVFSKFEQPQSWGYKNNLEEFMLRKFRRTKSSLQRWRRTWNCKVALFACSAFGTMGRPPRPNFRLVQRSREATSGGIARPDVWRPFGLVAPLYWLRTGKNDSRLWEI